MGDRPPKVDISDHALVRFLERAYGLGEFLDSVRDEMRRGAIPAIEFGASCAIVHKARLIIRDGHIVVTALRKGRR